jgi:hypothetical protein
MELADVAASFDTLHVVAHSDLDGVASAAIIVRWARSQGKEASWDVVGVRGLYRTLVSRMRMLLGRPGSTLIVVADMSPRVSDVPVYLSLVRRGKLEMVWIDHHEWSSELRSLLERNGVHIYLDRRDVTAALACRLLGCSSDPVSRRLVEMARYDDSCSPDPEGLSERWRVVLKMLPPEKLARVVEDLASGRLWPSWADEVYRSSYASYYESVRSTHVSTYAYEGVRVAVASPQPNVSPCDLDLAGILPGPREADVVVVLYPRSLSIRTWGRLSADCIARKMGGGGHRNAAGAPRPSLSMGPAQLARLVARYARECGQGEEVS